LGGGRDGGGDSGDRSGGQQNLLHHGRSPSGHVHPRQDEQLEERFSCPDLTVI
jgi:hypothetical protein